MDAVIYCRGSGRLDEAAVKIAEQERNCHKYADTNDHRLVRLFQDVGSATCEHRSGLITMIEFLSKQSEPMAVIVSDGHVLTRSIADHMSLKQAISETGAIVRYALSANDTEPMLPKVSIVRS